MTINFLSRAFGVSTFLVWCSSIAIVEGIGKEGLRADGETVDCSSDRCVYNYKLEYWCILLDKTYSASSVFET